MPRLQDRVFHFALSRQSCSPRYFDRILNKLIYYRNNNDLNNLELNGEYHVIKKISESSSNIDVVIDVGASAGDYSSLIRKVLTEAFVIAYELDPDNAGLLSVRFKDDIHFQVCPFGLSDASKHWNAISFPGHGNITSLYELPWSSESVPKEVETRRASCELAPIIKKFGKIDLLKLDVEGHELVIITEIRDLLPHIRLSQFEYNRNWILANASLREAYALLRQNAWIGKVYQRGVVFKDYDLFSDENFENSNYLALRKGENELLKLLELRT